MNKKVKKVLIFSGVTLILLVVINSILNAKIESVIENKIEEFSSKASIEYNDLEISAFKGNIGFTDLKLRLLGETTDSTTLKASFKNLKIKDVSYWNWMVNNKLDIENIEITKPDLVYKHNPKADIKTFKSNNVSSFNKEIFVKQINISDGKININNFYNGSTIANVNQFNVSSNNVVYNALNSNKPFQIEAFTINLDSVFYKLNNFENLNIETIKFSEQSTAISNIQLKTKYTKKELSGLLKTERDHFNVNINTINLNNQEVGVNSNNKFFFKAENSEINTVKAVIYRDKLVKDDTLQKPMYSKMLRDLDFNLGLNTVKIKNLDLVYVELVNKNEKAGELNFSNLNANIFNVGNVYDKTIKTRANIKSTFMKNTPITIDWMFSVKDPSDAFAFKGEINNLAGQDLNPFLKPNLNIEFDGDLDKIYFTIDGNKTKSNIDLKTKYKEFEVVVLNKKGNEKNKLLSGLVNLFISKNSNDNPNNFRKGNSEDVKRDKTKSVFNFVWVNLKSGLLSAMAGDGEKDKK